MWWLLAAVLALAVAALVRRLVRERSEGVGWYEFERLLHSLLVMKKPGGTLTLRHLPSGASAVFRRGAEEDACCAVDVELRGDDVDGNPLDSARRRLTARGYEVEAVGATPPRVRLRVDDFRHEASGATGARVAQEFFEALGIASTDRFRVQLEGPNSIRLWQDTSETLSASKNAIVRAIGRRIAAEVEQERRKTGGESGNGDPPRSGDERD